MSAGDGRQYALSIDMLPVADIDAPDAELNAINGTYGEGNGTVMAYKGTEYTLYNWDGGFHVTDSPNVVAGSTGHWLANGGKYTNEEDVGLGGKGVLAVVVADIDDPSPELNALSATEEADLIIAYQDVDEGQNEYTLYAWDGSPTHSALTSAYTEAGNSAVQREDIPYTVDGDGGRWIAIAGKAIRDKAVQYDADGNVIIAPNYGALSGSMKVIKIAPTATGSGGTVDGLYIDLTGIASGHTARTIYLRGGNLNIAGDYSILSLIASFIDSADGVKFRFLKGRGIEASRAAVQSGDSIVQIQANAQYSASGNTEGGRIAAKATENWGANNKGTEWVFSVIPTGYAATPTLTDILKVVGTGLQLLVGDMDIPSGSVYKIDGELPLAYSEEDLAAGTFAADQDKALEVVKLTATAGAIDLTDITKDVGSNLITFWMNAYSPYNFDTLTIDGVDIDSAIWDPLTEGHTYAVAVTDAGAGATAFTLTNGKSYRLTIDLTLNSGTAPETHIFDAVAGGDIADFTAVTPVNGLNVYNFTMTETLTGKLYLLHSEACNWSATFSLYEQVVDGLVKILMAGDSNVTIKHDTDYIDLDGDADFSMLAGDVLALVCKSGVWVEAFRKGIYNSNPAMDGSASVGSSKLVSRGDHVHPTDTSRAPLDNPVFATKVGVSAVSVDMFPGLIGAGLAYRGINRLGSVAYQHFNGADSIPSGYAWASSPFITPDSITYNYGGCYLMEYETSAGGTGVRSFIAKGLTNDHDEWNGKILAARLGCINVGSCGIRLDDGTDNNYVELYLEAGGTGGEIQTLYYASNTGGAGRSSAATSLVLPAGEFLTLYMYPRSWSEGAGDHHFVQGGIMGESGVGGTVCVNWDLGVGGSAWWPAAGRAGIITYHTVNWSGGAVDWLYLTIG